MTEKTKLPEGLLELLTGDSAPKRCAGRLLATEFHSNFMAWIEGEMERNTSPMVLIQATCQVLTSFQATTVGMLIKDDAPDYVAEDIGELLKKLFVEQVKKHMAKAKKEGELA